MGENRYQKLPDGIDDATMMKQEQETFEQNNPEDSAAFLFQMYFPKYRELIKRMPRKALERLSLALVAGALAETEYKPTTDHEKAAYVLGDKVLQARWVMQLHTLHQVQKQLDEARAQAATAQPAPEGSIPLSEVLQTKTVSDIIETTNLTEGDTNG